MNSKPAKNSSTIATNNWKIVRTTSKNAMQLFTKQAINSQSATPTIQAAPTVYLNAILTSQTPKMPTLNAIGISLHLKN